MIAAISTSVMDNFGRAMLILVEGMAGIFFFMALFYLLILALEKVFKPGKAQ